MGLTVTIGDIITRVMDRYDAAAGRDAWQASTTHQLRAERVANGGRWQCVTPGISAATGTGPAPVMHGTPATVDVAGSASILDGTVCWKWLSAWTIVSTAPTTSIIGEQGEGQNDAPPRLVWVPGHDTFGPANMIGPSPAGRAVRTRHAGVECHVWAAPATTPSPAANLSAAELMVNAIIYAIHEELRVGLAFGTDNTWFGYGCRYDLRGQTWHTAGMLEQFGVGCTLDLVFDLPVLAPAPVSVRPLTFALNQEIST